MKSTVRCDDLGCDQCPLLTGLAQTPAEPVSEDQAEQHQNSETDLESPIGIDPSWIYRGIAKGRSEPPKDSDNREEEVSYRCRICNG